MAHIREYPSPQALSDVWKWAGAREPLGDKSCFHLYSSLKRRKKSGLGTNFLPRSRSSFPLFPLIFTLGDVFVSLTQESGNKRETRHGSGSFELVEILFLRQTIEEETAFGIFSLLKRIFRCVFVFQCKNYPCSRLQNT